MKQQLLLLFTALCLCSSALAQQIDVTIVNNSADPELRLVDVYVEQAGEYYKIEDLAYQTGRNASEVAFLFSNFETKIHFAPSNSTNVNDAFVNRVFEGEEGDAFVLVLNGLRSTTGFLANPDGRATTPTLNLLKVPLAPSDPVSNTGIFVIHGSTDMTRFDLKLSNRPALAAMNLGYGDQTQTMVEVKRESIGMQMLQAGTQKILGGFNVDLSGVTPITVFVLSGFQTPGDNNGSTDSLALLGVLESGAVVRYPLTSGSQSARVQFIHNMAEPTFSVMNLWLNRELLTRNFQYRRGTAFADFPAGVPLKFGFSLNTVTNYAQVRDTIELPTLRPGRSYQILFSGIKDSARYVGNPDSINIKLSATIFEGGLERSPETGSTALRTIHGVQDAPGLSFETRRRGSLNNRLAYTDGSAVYNVAPAGTDTIVVRNLTTGAIIASFQADLRGNDRATSLLASGFLDPAKNNNASAANYGFRLLLIEANGTSTVLSNAIDTLAQDTTKPDTTNSIYELGLVDPSAWSVAPIPASTQVVISVLAPEFSLARFDIFDIHGTRLASQQASGANDLRATFSAELLPSGTYHVVATLPDGRILGTTKLVIAR